MRWEATQKSARLSGINVGKTKIIAFITVQILAVISGLMTAGQVMAGTFTFGKGWELDVIAVVVGGTSFTGGCRDRLGNPGGRDLYGRDWKWHDPVELSTSTRKTSCGRRSCSWLC